MNAWEKSLATRVHWLRTHQSDAAANHVELAAKEMTAEFERLKRRLERRDLFAAHALTATVARHHADGEQCSDAIIARDAVALADALLVELDRGAAVPPKDLACVTCGISLTGKTHYGAGDGTGQKFNCGFCHRSKESATRAALRKATTENGDTE